MNKQETRRKFLNLIDAVEARELEIKRLREENKRLNEYVTLLIKEKESLQKENRRLLENLSFQTLAKKYRKLQKDNQELVKNSKVCNE